MADPSIGVMGARGQLVSDQSYLASATAMIAGARSVAMAMVFIVDPDPIEDTKLAVDGLLHTMAEAQWRGLSTRLIVGGSRVNGAIQEACMMARDRAQQLGVPCRLVSAKEQQSVHTKILVADDYVLLGSHNWSPGALGGSQTQDSVLVKDAALSGFFVSRILMQWTTAREEGFDVPD